MKIPFWDNQTLVGLGWAALTVAVFVGAVISLIWTIKKFW